MESNNFMDKASTKILRILPESKKKVFLELEENPFRVAGGGQPGDGGALRSEGFEAQVLDCRKSEKGVLLEALLKRGTPMEGLAVEASVDMALRQRYSQMHSGEHILSRALESLLENLHVYKVAIEKDETSVSFTYPGEITWDILFEAEKLAGQKIAQDIPVSVEEISRKEATKIPTLKANWDRIESETIRIVRIEDFDCIACSGSHVASTGKVGSLFITGYNGSSPEWSLKFRLDGDVLKNHYGQLMRRTMRHLGCKSEKLLPSILKMQEEKGDFLRLLGKVRHHISLPWETLSLGKNLSFHGVILEGFSRELVSPEVKRRITDFPGDVVVALLPGDGPAVDFILAKGEACPLDSLGVIRDPSLGIRGGGAPEWVAGIARARDLPSWEKAIRAKLSEMKG